MHDMTAPNHRFPLVHNKNQRTLRFPPTATVAEEE